MPPESWWLIPIEIVVRSNVIGYELISKFVFEFFLFWTNKIPSLKKGKTNHEENRGSRQLNCFVWSTSGTYTGLTIDGHKLRKPIIDGFSRDHRTAHVSFWPFGTPVPVWFWLGVSCSRPSSAIYLDQPWYVHVCVRTPRCSSGRLLRVWRYIARTKLVPDSAIVPFRESSNFMLQV